MKKNGIEIVILDPQFTILSVMSYILLITNQYTSTSYNCRRTGDLIVADQRR